jgi:hypothetical protein
VDLETPLEQSPKSPKSPLEQSPKSPLEVLDEALDLVMPSTFSLPVAPPRGKQKRGMTTFRQRSFIMTIPEKRYRIEHRAGKVGPPG